MDKVVEFIDCPAYLDDSGALRCGLPAEVVGRYSLGSAHGRLTAATIVCPLGYRFNATVDALLMKPRSQQPTTPVDTQRPESRRRTTEDGSNWTRRVGEGV
jgi:hypothetical protein